MFSVFALRATKARDFREAARLPRLAAFLRCAIDIRNVDVPAASRAGVLVTQASAGFVTSVTELVFGFLIDLSRGITRHTLEYRQGRVPSAWMGKELKGSALGVIGYGEGGLLGRLTKMVVEGALEGELDRRLREGAEEVHVLHGHGSGALKSAIREHLARSPYVRRARAGESHEGGDAITVAELSG